MSAKVCKKCQQSYAVYMERCPHCYPLSGGPQSTKELSTGEHVTLGTAQPAHVTPNVTEPPQVVTPSVTVTENVTPAQPCPLCGQKVPMSHAQRQKAYRERRPSRPAPDHS